MSLGIINYNEKVRKIQLFVSLDVEEEEIAIYFIKTLEAQCSQICALWGGGVL